MLINKRVGESDVIPKAWMFHSSRSIVGHPFTLENDQGRPVDLKKRLDRKNTITHVLDENLHSLSKRWFFGNEEAHGVTTIRSQLNSRNPTTPIGASNDAGGLPMVSLPSGKLAPLWNDSNLEKSERILNAMVYRYMYQGIDKSVLSTFRISVQVIQIYRMNGREMVNWILFRQD